jgi:hypothetical protein
MNRPVASLHHSAGSQDLSYLGTWESCFRKLYIDRRRGTRRQDISRVALESNTFYPAILVARRLFPKDGVLIYCGR